jgi:hypothetical protein
LRVSGDPFFSVADLDVKLRVICRLGRRWIADGVVKILTLPDATDKAAPFRAVLLLDVFQLSEILLGHECPYAG